MTDDSESKVLTSHDRQSPVWTKLRKHMEAKLQALRIKNDTDLDPVATAKVRGEIRNLKNLLALGDTPDPVTVADDDTGE